MREPKYIDAKEFWNRLISVSENDWVGFDTIDEILSEMPAADGVEVVRCKDCKYDSLCFSDVEMTNRRQTEKIHKQIEWCSYGERKDG